MKVKEWVNIIECNTPSGTPNLVYGWPDEEYGITWDRYIDDIISKLDNLQEGSPLPKFPNFQEWRKRKRRYDLDDLGLSYNNCDLCGSQPGYRHAVTALPNDIVNDGNYLALSVCKDCLLYITNGEVPDWLEGDDD